MCELTFRYARAGDAEARSALYEVVERPPVDDPTRGRDQLVELEGEGAIVFVARVVGAVADHAWDWPDDIFVEDAVYRFGRERVESLLLGSTDPAVLRFGEAWRRQELHRRENARQSHADRMRAIGVEEVFEAAERGQDRCAWFRGWGMYADERDLNVVYVRLCAEPDPFVQARLLRAFSKRPLPRFDERLLALAVHADEDVRRAAAGAFAKKAHPAIRRVALEQLDAGQVHLAVRLLTSNFEEGDEDRILAAMDLPEDEWELHGLLSGLVEVDETYVGGLEEVPGRGAKSKALVVIAVEKRGRALGRARLAVVERASMDELGGFVERSVERGSVVRTDGWDGYRGLARAGYEHDRVGERPGAVGVCCRACIASPRC